MERVLLDAIGVAVKGTQGRSSMSGEPTAEDLLEKEGTEATLRMIFLLLTFLNIPVKSNRHLGYSI